MDTWKENSQKTGRESDRRPSGRELKIQTNPNESRRTDANPTRGLGSDGQGNGGQGSATPPRDAEAPIQLPASSEEREMEPGTPVHRPDSSPENQRWTQIVAEFVDDPRRAVIAAHELVGQAVQRIVDELNAQHSAMEQQWASRSDVSTETLRICVQQYRAFFNRLVSEANTATPRGARAEPTNTPPSST